MNKKLIFSLFLLTILVLVGCGNSKKDTENTKNSNTDKKETEIIVNHIDFKGSKLTKNDFSSQEEIDSIFLSYDNLVDTYYESGLIVADNIKKAFDNNEDRYYEIAKNLTDSFKTSDNETLEKMPNDDERYGALVSLKDTVFGFMDYNVRLYEKVIFNDKEVTDEELNQPAVLGELVDIELEYAQNVGIKNGSTKISQDKTDSQTTNENSSENVGSDITKLSKSPTDEQKEILLILANQQFKKDFPYKGSKLHSILGVLQDWTQDSESWYYKSQATIVNTYGAKEDVNVEIFITPTSPDTGEVEIISY